jgi:fumarate reductase flavoprotein subunit
MRVSPRAPTVLLSILFCTACQSPAPNSAAQMTDIIDVAPHPADIQEVDTALADDEILDMKIVDALSLEAGQVDASPVDLPPVDVPWTALEISDATPPEEEVVDVTALDMEPEDLPMDAMEIDDTFADADAEDAGMTPFQVEEPVSVVDVLVIGGGPAGLSAAWEAREAGASVIILEMGERAGGAGWYAANFFAVETPWQADSGYSYSVDQALAQWPKMTGGGDPTDPRVVDFLEHSAETLLWLVDDLGVKMGGLSPYAVAGGAPLTHLLLYDGHGPVKPLVDSLAAETWLQHRADSLVVEDGAVVGAHYTNLGTGEGGWIQAHATVMATGGFARDMDRVLADRPELAGTNLVFDNYPLAVGAGHPLLEQVGAQFQNPGTHGIYIHSVADYRPGFENEALWMLELFNSVIIDSNGMRVINEYEIMGFKAVQKLVNAPDKKLWAILPATVFEGMDIWVPEYNWADEDTPEEIGYQELLSNDAAWVYQDLESLAAGLGFDTAGVTATMALYESYVKKKKDCDFGKPMMGMSSFKGGPYYVVELAAGIAKAMGGAALSVEAEILDGAGQPIPGLFGAGEMAGMLGTPAIAKGLSGSLTACYYLGRVAGQSAADAAFAANSD